MSSSHGMDIRSQMVIISDTSLAQRLDKINHALSVLGVKIEVVDASVVKISAPREILEKAVEGIKLLAYAVPLERIVTFIKRDEYFDVVSLSSENSAAQIKRTIGRIIGRNGRTKQMLQEATGAEVYITGSEVLVVGDYSAVAAARDALLKIAQGKPQNLVLRSLRRR